MDRRRLRQVGVLLVGAAFLGYWALLVYCDLWKPSPLGLHLSSGRGGIRVEAVESGTPAQRAGIRTGDRIISSDGQPLASRLDWITVEANVEIGKPMRLSVGRTGAMFEAALIPELASWQSWRSGHGPELLGVRAMLLVTLLVAGLVGIRRPSDAPALLGAVFLATLSIFSVTLPYRFASAWRALPTIVSLPLWIPFVSSVAIAAWAFSFFANFPRPRLRTPLTWAVVWLPIAPGLVGQAVFGYYAIVLGRPAPTRLPWAESLLFVGAIYIVAAVAVMLLTYRRLTDINERRRVRVVLVGLLIGAIAGMPVVLSYWYTTTSQFGRPLLASPLATVGAFLFLVLPFSFAYAVLRHRLFDVSVIVRQGIRYLLARRAVLGILPAVLVFLGMDLLAHGSKPVVEVLRQRLWLYAALAIATVVVRTQQHGWLSALDRRFFRERYSAQRLLRQVAEDVRQATSLELVAPTVVSRVEQALHPAFVALLVRNSAGDCYRTAASAPLGRASEGRLTLRTDDKVLKLAGLTGRPVEVADAHGRWPARQLPLEDVDSNSEAAIDLVVPIAAAAEATPAFLVLGAKRSEEPYTEDDRELLMAIAESIALGLTQINEGAAVSTAVEECPLCGDCYDAGTARCHHDGATLASLKVPRLLRDRYRLERRLGRGGMGTVYVALDNLLDRQVAVKIVREDLIDLPGAAERFQREARAAAAFSHPNVVTVHDFGVARTNAFLVMELLNGPTLRDALRVEPRIGHHRALALLGDIAAAIEAAHGRQMVHRDLKPENICLVDSGSGERAKVLDFGLARFMTPEDGDPFIGHLASGAIVGTPYYMAPEQLRGEEPSPSWDLWALAVIAFEMLCGAHPFASITFADDVATSGAAVDPRLLHLPAGSQTFFTEALAIDRLNRPESATLLVAKLARSLNG